MTALGVMLSHLAAAAVGLTAGVVFTGRAAGIPLRPPPARRLAAAIAARLRAAATGSDDAWDADVRQWDDTARRLGTSLTDHHSREDHHR